ncbi:MAG: hypothetical protein CMI06_06825 [Oceanospirillaceae bacterium]|nr:hypothetical protein [Oceanospirillaceae bacterium]
MRKSYKQQFWLTVGGEQVAVHLSAMRRKSMRMLVNAEGEVDLRIPLGYPKAEVLAFVNANHDWLLKRRSEVLARQQEARQSVLIRGRELPFKSSALDEFMVAEQAVWVPEGWTPAQTQQALDNWLRGQARHEYPQMIERWWPFFSQFDVRRPQLRIKKMRTRWGSLSQRGYINLNLALMQLPTELMELVVVHELCHLRHFDHGAGFKALMTQCLPDWKQREQQLNQLSRRLL